MTAVGATGATMSQLASLQLRAQLQAALSLPAGARSLTGPGPSTRQRAASQAAAASQHTLSCLTPPPSPWPAGAAVQYGAQRW